MSTPASHPIVQYLAAALPQYQDSPVRSVPDYDGPSDQQTAGILQAVAAMAARMHTAEDEIARLRADREPASHNVPPIFGTAGSVALAQSPLPIDPLAAQAFGSVFTVIEELKLLKAGLTDVTRVCAAVARGDLSQKIAIPVSGTVMEQLKAVVDDMVDQLNGYANNALYLSRENGMTGTPVSVNYEGVWGDILRAAESGPGSAPVGDVIDGEELALMKTQAQEVTRICNAVARGDLLQKCTIPGQDAVTTELRDAVNGMLHRLTIVSSEISRISLEATLTGELDNLTVALDSAGDWRDVVANVHKLAVTLITQTHTITKITKNVALGNFNGASEALEGEALAVGDLLMLKNTIKDTLLRIRVFVTEATRVGMEGSRYGKLGGQIMLPEGETQGMWSSFVRSINELNMTSADIVRSITEVANAVKNGDLSVRMALPDAAGSIEQMQRAVNDMVVHLATRTQVGQVEEDASARL